MRKQTKLVAVLSAAALLALGATMTSFAAEGWTEEDGTWVYYDRNGDRVQEGWKRSGDYWYWLDENGEMATDMLVEYKDNYYYVDENGAMVANKWVALDNEDAGDDDEPDQWWYYFQSNGKAYKRSDSATNATFKTINGRKYTFDEEGKMMYGWLDSAGDRLTDEDSNWAEEGVYYCGDQNDGGQVVGWIELTINDPDWESDVDANWSSKNTFDDEEQVRWFYFESNGKKMHSKTGKTINGRKYSFDSKGRMNAEWIYQSVAGAPASPFDTAASQASAGASYAQSWRYFGTPEDGARVTKGWFKIVPGEYLNETDYNDDEDAWYYGDTNGELAAGKFKSIKNKKYGFKTNGAMLDGLKLIETDGTTISGSWADDSDDYRFDTEDDFLAVAQRVAESGKYFYYFGGEDDGAMKTGKTSLDIDGDKFNFYFTKSGTFKGTGFTGVDDKKLYVGGMNIKAGSDDKYKVVRVTGDISTPSSWIYQEKVDVYELINGDIGYLNPSKSGSKANGDRYWVFDKAAADQDLFIVVNASGTIQKDKSSCKDGNDYKISVNKYELSQIVLED